MEALFRSWMPRSSYEKEIGRWRVHPSMIPTEAVASGIKLVVGIHLCPPCLHCSSFFSLTSKRKRQQRGRKDAKGRRGLRQNIGEWKEQKLALHRIRGQHCGMLPQPSGRLGLALDKPISPVLGVSTWLKKPTMCQLGSHIKENTQWNNVYLKQSLSMVGCLVCLFSPFFPLSVFSSIYSRKLLSS